MQAVLIPIKIQCGCGQRYAFDVEPVGGRMPGPVSCPVCGADGTSAANMALAQALRGSTVAHARGRNQIGSAASDSGFAPLPPSARKRLPGQMNPEQAE